MTERTFVVTLHDSEERSGKKATLTFTESQIRQSERLTHALEYLLCVEENVAAGMIPRGNTSLTKYEYRTIFGDPAFDTTVAENMKTLGEDGYRLAHSYTQSGTAHFIFEREIRNPINLKFNTMVPAPLKIGDVVRLKSGGPQMTVQGIDGLISCAWFTGQDVCHDTFVGGTLIVV